MSLPDLLERLRELASRIAAEQGVELVDLTLRRGGHTLLRLDIDRAGPVGATIEDCQQVSHAVGAALEQDDSIASRYVLEVSTPGLDRPIRTADDFRRNTGRRVEVETSEPVGGKRTFRGVLLGIENDLVTLLDDGGAEMRFPLASIVRARQEMKF